jgi:integrase
MVRIDVKGIHRVRYTTTDGQIIHYHYAWRGGPRFWRSDTGPKLGGADYFAAYRDALEARSPAKGLFREVLMAYLASPEFNRLRPRSRADIERSIRHPLGIDAKFGPAPVGVFNRPEVRTIAYKWRDQFKPRQADHMMAHLGAIISWALDRGHVKAHHLRHVTKLYSSDRSQIIWTDQEIATFAAGAPPYVARILIAATETGMRPGDLATLSRGHIQRSSAGRRILFKTGKKQRMASIPVTQAMGKLIDETPDHLNLILTGARGTPFKDPAKMGRYVSQWRDKLGLRPVIHLYDARGTAATRLLEANGSLQEIALAMGWSPQHTARMIEIYAKMNPDASDSLLAKLEANLRARL